MSIQLYIRDSELEQLKEGRTVTAMLLRDVREKEFWESNGIQYVPVVILLPNELDDHK